MARESLTKTSSRGARFKSNNMTGSTSIFDEWRDEVTDKDAGGDQGTLGPCVVMPSRKRAKLEASAVEFPGQYSTHTVIYTVRCPISISRSRVVT